MLNGEVSPREEINLCVCVQCLTGSGGVRCSVSASFLMGRIPVLVLTPKIPMFCPKANNLRLMCLRFTFGPIDLQMSDILICTL